MLGLSELVGVIEVFLAAKKAASESIRWSPKDHPDYHECSIPMITEDFPHFNARLVLSAHTSRLPRKYGFTLLLGGEKALRLDVNPGSSHFDPVTLTAVSDTHWQPWPGTRAIKDSRDLNHLGWFNKFLTKARIEYSGVYVAPPFTGGQQLRLV